MLFGDDHPLPTNSWPPFAHEPPSHRTPTLHCSLATTTLCPWFLTCVTWLIHKCDMTHPYVRRDWSICVTWLIHMCDMPHRDLWLIYMCNMTDDRIPTLRCSLATTILCPRTLTYVTWIIHPLLTGFLLCDALLRRPPSAHELSHVWHDSSICVTCLI